MGHCDDVRMDCGAACLQEIFETSIEKGKGNHE